MDLAEYRAISALFEEQVRLQPKRTAIYLDDRTISYQEFNQRANQYAHFCKK